MMKQKAEQSQVEKKKKNADSGRNLAKEHITDYKIQNFLHMNNSHSLKLSLNCNLQLRGSWSVLKHWADTRQKRETPTIFI
jgi:hypothetical protein